jgi:hypothetical protein
VLPRVFHQIWVGPRPFPAFQETWRRHHPGSVPGHPLLERATREARPQDKGGTCDKTASGSLFFDRIVKDFPEVTIFPAAWFYPASRGERSTAYAVHHSARSWKDVDECRQAALRAEERLEKERRSHHKTKARVAALEEVVRTLKTKIKKTERRTRSVAPRRRRRYRGASSCHLVAQERG